MCPTDDVELVYDGDHIYRCPACGHIWSEEEVEEMEHAELGLSPDDD